MHDGSDRVSQCHAWMKHAPMSLVSRRVPCSFDKFIAVCLRAYESGCSRRSTRTSSITSCALPLPIPPHPIEVNRVSQLVCLGTVRLANSVVTGQLSIFDALVLMKVEMEKCKLLYPSEDFDDDCSLVRCTHKLSPVSSFNLRLGLNVDCFCWRISNIAFVKRFLVDSNVNRQIRFSQMS